MYDVWSFGTKYSNDIINDFEQYMRVFNFSHIEYRFGLFSFTLKIALDIEIIIIGIGINEQQTIRNRKYA